MQSGKVIGIFITPEKGQAMNSVQEVYGTEAKGLEGDRYAQSKGTFSKQENLKQQVTFIESEALESVLRDYNLNITPTDTRRNILTEGIALNHLVDKEFRVGELIFKGTELCEPCGYLEKKAQKEDLKKVLKHRGGIRAKILKGGLIKVGDSISH